MDTRRAGVGGGQWCIPCDLKGKSVETETLKLKSDFLLLLLSLLSRSLQTRGSSLSGSGWTAPTPTHEYARDGFTYIRAV